MSEQRVRGRIKIDHTDRPNVSASGRDYRHGEMAELSEDDAAILAALGLFELVEGGSATRDAAEDGKRLITAAASQAAASHARSVMSLYDTMPAEWRRRVQEEGEHVMDEYMLSLPSTPIEELEPEKPARRRRRGSGQEGEEA